jgi:DNA-binding Lrp family transcriptional regulator
MMTSIVLLKVEPRKINEIAEALADMDGISEVYSVGGRFDLVAVVRVPRNEDLADLVTNQMVQLDGIRDTESMVAYRAYSRHDLECLFSVGLD